MAPPEDPPADPIKSPLRALRTALRLTQNEIVARSSRALTQPFLSRLESGAMGPESSRGVVGLSTALGVPQDLLLNYMKGLVHVADVKDAYESANAAASKTASPGLAPPKWLEQAQEKARSKGGPILRIVSQALGNAFDKRKHTLEDIDAAREIVGPVSSLGELSDDNLTEIAELWLDAVAALRQQGVTSPTPTDLLLSVSSLSVRSRGATPPASP